MNIKKDKADIKKKVDKAVSTYRTVAEKLHYWWGNLCIIYETIMDHKKLSLCALVVVLVGGSALWHWGVKKVPNAVNCTYKAWWLDGLRGNQWQFNWSGRNWQEQCKYRRPDGRLVPYDKNGDVGIDEVDLN